MPEVTGHLDSDPAAMTDYSPDGFAERDRFNRAMLARLASTVPESEADRIARRDARAPRAPD